MTRREIIESAYKAGVEDVLDYLIEINPDPEHWQEFIKDTGKTFDVEVNTLNELINNISE